MTVFSVDRRAIFQEQLVALDNIEIFHVNLLDGDLLPNLSEIFDYLEGDVVELR